MKSDPCRYIEIKDEFQQGLLNFAVIEAITTDKGGQKGIETGKCLGPCSLTLQGIEKINYLA